MAKRKTYGTCVVEGCGREAKYKAARMCVRCYNKNLYATNEAYREKCIAVASDKNKRTLYGITQAEYDAQNVLQEGKCAICKKQCPTSYNLAVDHDHTTGRVRGLLCNNCNQGLGRFFDDVELMKAAIAYLEEGGVW